MQILKPLKKCRTCGLEANSQDDLSLFKLSKKAIYGRDGCCKKCDNAKAQINKAKNPEKWLKDKRNASFIQKYGLTIEQRTKYILSIGKCEICGCGVTEKTAHIDHSHDQNKIKHIRGVLCGTCNTGLGKFKDNVELLNKATKYLIEREYLVNPEPFDIAHGLDFIFHQNKEVNPKDFKCPAQ